MSMLECGAGKGFCPDLTSVGGHGCSHVPVCDFEHWEQRSVASPPLFMLRTTPVPTALKTKWNQMNASDYIPDEAFACLSVEYA